MSWKTVPDFTNKGSKTSITKGIERNEFVEQCMICQKMKSQWWGPSETRCMSSARCDSW